MIVQGSVFWILNRYAARAAAATLAPASFVFGLDHLRWCFRVFSCDCSLLHASVGIMVSVPVSVTGCTHAHAGAWGEGLSASYSAWEWGEESLSKFKKDSSTIACCCRFSFLGSP